MVKINIIFFCLCLVISQSSYASAELSICYDLQPSPPYMYAGKAHTDSASGILIDLITITGVETGINIKLYRKPWKRCISDVRNGYADGVLAAIWQKERDEWGLFPKTLDGAVDEALYLWRASYQLFVNKKTDLSWDGKTISGVTTGIAAPLGYIVAKKLKQEGLLAPNVYDANKAFQLIAKHRLDGYIIEALTGKNIINDLQLSTQVMPLKRPYLIEKLYLVFSKKSKKVTEKKAQLIWQSLAKIRRRDKAKLIEKHMPSLDTK